MPEQVLLVDQSERFVFKPMLYELLSGGMLSVRIYLNFLFDYIFEILHFIIKIMYVASSIGLSAYNSVKISLQK